MNVLIADDHELLAEAVAQSLSRNEGLSAVVATSLAGTMDELSSHEYDIVLLDLRMPGMMGLSSVESVLKRAPGVNVVLFTGQIDRRFLDDAVKLGVKGYIPKSMPLKSLDVSLRLIYSGQTFIPHHQPQESQLNASNLTSEPLVERELFVLRLAADGMINKEIARDLGISEAQVKMIMRQVCQKLGARNRAHACVVSRERMLI